MTGNGQGANGSVSCSAAGLCTYTPSAGFSGSDTFTYTVSDGNGGSASAAVIVTVEAGPPANHDPIATDDSLTTVGDTPGSLNVLSNDYDSDSDPLSVTASTNGAHGSVGCTLAGICTYTPNAGFAGTDSFTYTLSDGVGGTATGTVSVTVQPTTPGNNPPVAENDTLTVTSGKIGYVYPTSNDSDLDADFLQLASNTEPQHGSLTCYSSYCTYASTQGYAGPDSFDYVVSDGKGGTDTGSVAITVEANRNPVAVDDSVVVTVGASTILDVLGNDYDLDFDPLEIASNSPPQHGSATCGPSQCTYASDVDFVGTDSFTYVTADGFGGTDEATVRSR